MSEDYRQVTEWEIFRDEFFVPYKIIMEKVFDLAKELQVKKNVEMRIQFDINAATFTLHKMWRDSASYIDNKRKQRQAEIDDIEQEKINKGG